MEKGKTYIQFNPKLNVRNLNYFHPRLLRLMAHFAWYADKFKLETEVLRLKTRIIRHTTHNERVTTGFDANISKWPKERIHNFIYKTNSEYEHIGIEKNGKRKAVTYEEEEGVFHFHITLK